MTNKKHATEFLLYSVLGSIENPTVAAINRAYRDMAAHTINTDPSRKKITQNKIYENRKRGTDYLEKEINAYADKETFADWHKRICISETLGPYTIGQRQKWLNMTLKYLFVMHELEVDGINEKLMEHFEEFHSPIDSYVLEYIDCCDEGPWSNINDYSRYMKMKEKISFLEELETWQTMAEKSKYTKAGKLKTPPQNTYERFLFDLNN